MGEGAHYHTHPNMADTGAQQPPAAGFAPALAGRETRVARRWEAPSGPAGRRPRSAATMQSPGPALAPCSAHGGDGPRGPLPTVPGSLSSRRALLSPSPGSSVRQGTSPPCSGGDSPRPRSARHTRIGDFICNTWEMNEISFTRKKI